MTTKTSLLCLLTSALICLGASRGHTAVFYAQANHTSGSQTIDNLTLWFDQTSGGGNNPTELAGHSFFSQGFNLRTGTGNFTFGDSSTFLTLSATAGNGLILRAGPSNIITLPNLISDGGRITAGVGTASLNVTNFSIGAGGVSLKPEDGAVRAINLGITSLTGAGEFGLFSQTHGGTIFLNAANALTYSGNITFSGNVATTLDFQNDFVSGGGLVVTDAFSRVALDQNVTFNALSINGISQGAGTYSWATLNTLAPTIFLAGGSGSITVVPELGPAPLLMAGALCCLTGKRRRRV